MGSRSNHRRPRTGTSRFRTVRFKVTALVLVSLVSLSILWAFAASVTLGEGLNLRNVETVQDHFEYPSGALGSTLQAERRATMVYLGGKQPTDFAVMEAARLVTDRQASLFRRLAGDKDALDAAPATTRRLADEIVRGLDGLAGKRNAIDTGGTQRAQAFADYTGLIGGIGTLQGTLSTLNNSEVAKDARNQVALARAREALSQEDALLAGVLAAGRISRAEHAAFVKAVGTQRALYDIASPELRTEDRTYFRRVTSTPQYGRLRALEDRYVNSVRLPRAGADAPVLWKTTVDSNLTRLRGLELSLIAAAEQRAEPISNAIIMRVALAGVLGLIAVVLSVILAIWAARSVVRDLNGLKREALDLAGSKLPGVIRRLRRGEEVDVAAEAPPLSFSTEEIDQVGQAFNEARRTAIQGAVEEAGLRRGISEVFVNLARRSQTLLHRQLNLLDSMERRITEPDDLEDLFRIDHLATRMRRHAEGLIILSGQAPGRGWRNPVAVIDVARAAASEVEDYTRVSVAPMSQAAISGVAVADVIHLLAELIENACSFSPPHTSVQVTGQVVARGFSMEIEDRGLSMDAKSLAEANARLAEPPEFDLSDSAQLGLFVVGRLAKRHNIRVTLRTSPFGGMSAVVLIPEDIVVHGDGDGFQEAAPLALTRRSEDALVPAGVLRGGHERAALPAGSGGAVLRLHSNQPGQPVQPGQPGHPEPPYGPNGPTGPIPQQPGMPVGIQDAPQLGSRHRRPDGEPPRSVPDPAPAPEPPRPERSERPERSARPVQELRPERRTTGGPGSLRRPPGGASRGGGSRGGRPELPKRVRQANLAPQLREEAGGEPAPAPAESRAERSPEELRSMMSSIQLGTRRGRDETVAEPNIENIEFDEGS
ncbi:nitrate- and nitrite sensing domain-containing protein [Spirillospora sp. NPDC029432]|uniref:nitrate- and nitrite sensing domain-containing protein n=1 Tax=Spirillospora sp. NPDC029432 TaxID=3154599 RepID=UPI0034556ECE